MSIEYSNHYRLNIRIERLLNGKFRLHMGTDESWAFDSSQIIESPEKILEKIATILKRNITE